MSVHVLPMTGTAMYQNLGIPASRGNPASYVQVDGKNNRSSALPNWKS